MLGGTSGGGASGGGTVVPLPVNPLGGRRRKAGQSGRAVRANPDVPLAAPRRAELHRPNQGLICGCNGGFASSPGPALH